MKVDERIAERRREVRAERRRARLRRTITVTVVLVLLAVAYAIERSPLVALAEVRVEGNQRLQAAEIRSAADLELGTSTLRLHLADARRRVEALPLVHDATVRRIDPLTVLITVTERIPTAVLRGADGAVLVDDEGVVVAAGSQDGLPVIDLADANAPALGASVDEVPAAGNAHRVLEELPGPLRSEVDRYVALAADDVELRLVSGIRVAFGRAERIDEKARALGAVIEDLDGRTVTAIDVRAPMTPVVVP